MHEPTGKSQLAPAAIGQPRAAWFAAEPPEMRALCCECRLLSRSYSVLLVNDHIRYSRPTPSSQPMPFAFSVKSSPACMCPQVFALLEMYLGVCVCPHDVLREKVIVADAHDQIVDLILDEALLGTQRVSPSRVQCQSRQRGNDE